MLAFSKMARLPGLLQTRATVFLIRNYHKQPIEVVWKKPEHGWTKLNFDGSRKHGQASIGGIFRNHKGEFILGYSEPIGAATSTVAEFAALKRGLELVLENGWTDLWLEGDAKIIMDIISKRGRLRCQEAKKHVNYINVVMPGLSNCVLSHVYREGNRAADKLAKLGHQFQDPKVWRLHPPDIVLPIMHEDARVLETVTQQQNLTAKNGVILNGQESKIGTSSSSYNLDAALEPEDVRSLISFMASLTLWIAIFFTWLLQQYIYT